MKDSSCNLLGYALTSQLPSTRPLKSKKGFSTLLPTQNLDMFLQICPPDPFPLNREVDLTNRK